LLPFDEFSLFSCDSFAVREYSTRPFRDVKVVDRKQELVELHLSKVGLFLQAPKAYSPRPPKEIVAHRHYSPARPDTKNLPPGGCVPLRGVSR